MVCRETAFSGGKYVKIFEEDFSQFLGCDHFAGVSSGSDALVLSLRAMGVKPGDEVIVPANTFIATPFSVERVGARPVYVDCDPVTWEIDPVKVQEAITDKTVGIIGVHLYGQAFPVNEILEIAKNNDLFMLEDCAQAQGTFYHGKKVGTFGDTGCFSFYPGKNLGCCGEGGGVSTHSQEVWDKIACLRNQGSVEKYHHEELGYNMRLDGIQAVILSRKLQKLDGWNDRRREIVKKYHSEITNPEFTWQGELEYTNPAWYLAVACVEDREDFIKYMEANDIYVGIHYSIPCHLQKAEAHLGYKAGDFPNAEWESAHCVSLPLYPEMTDEDVKRVIDVCMKYKK